MLVFLIFWTFLSLPFQLLDLLLRNTMIGIFFAFYYAFGITWVLFLYDSFDNITIESIGEIRNYLNLFIYIAPFEFLFSSFLFFILLRFRININEPLIYVLLILINILCLVYFYYDFKNYVIHSEKVSNFFLPIISKQSRLERIEAIYNLYLKKKKEKRIKENIEPFLSFENNEKIVDQMFVSNI